MERKNKESYSGDGSLESPFMAFGSPDILTFALDVAKNNLEPILEGEKVYVKFNTLTFEVAGYPERKYFPYKVDVNYIENKGDSGHPKDVRMAVFYSQRFYSSFLMEILKKKIKEFAYPQFN